MVHKFRLKKGIKMDTNVQINLAIRDFKSNLTDLINNSEIPGFVIYEILNNYTLQVGNAIQSEIDAAAKQNSENVENTDA